MCIKLVTLLCLFLGGCKYSGLKKFDDSVENRALQKLPTGTIINYQLINKEIIAPKCLRCHSNVGNNAGGINLESYSNVLINLQLIKSEVETNRMPILKSTPLTRKEKEVFLAWLSLGAPNEPSPTDEEMPDVEKIDFKMVQEKVISLRCVSCHSEKGGNKGMVNLETYESTVDQLSIIQKELISGSMPRPRSRPLTEIQKKIFLSWIEKGAPKIH